MGAIQKKEHLIQESEKGPPRRLLMDLSEAFGTINRAKLWTTLYKNGLPLEMIITVRQGHQNTTLCAKNQGGYGKQIINNIGVFQGSAISALLFTIYLEDMMEDYRAINRKAKLATRITLQRNPEIETNELLKIIHQARTRTKQEKPPRGNKRNGRPRNIHGQKAIRIWKHRK